MTDSTSSDPLTGGDGVPHRRGDAVPESLFLLRPDNRAYLNGEAASIVPTEDEVINRRSSVMFIIFGSPFLCFMCALSALAWSHGDNTPASVHNRNGYTYFTLFLSIIFSITPILWFSAWRYRSKLVKRGKLLIGQISSIAGYWAVLNRVNYYFVTVEYRVHLPNHKVMHARETAIYMDMVGKPLPERGTPVAVLYVDDYAKRLL